MSRSIIDRMRGAAALDIATYEEVEADENATGQAAIVVALAAIASAIGAAGSGSGGIVMALLMQLVAWASWAGVAYFVGTRFFGGTATWGQLARTLGFAQAPGVLLVLGIIPILGGFVRIAVAIWMLVAGIVAIRQALDITTGKAVLTALVGWVIFVVIEMITGIFTGLLHLIF